MASAAKRQDPVLKCIFKRAETVANCDLLRWNAKANTIADVLCWIGIFVWESMSVSTDPVDVTVD